MLPALLALSMSLHYTTFRWWLAIVALIGIILGHLGMNLADDYFDYKAQGEHSREKMAAQGMRARIAKYPYLSSGKATLKELGMAITLLLALAALSALAIGVVRGGSIFLIAAVSFILGISYSGKPLQLGYKGFGELIIGLMFGPLLMIGMQLAASGTIDWAIIIVSLSVGLLVCNIVYTHSVLDQQADAAMQKMTFARVLHTKNKMLLFSHFLIYMPFLLIAFAICVRIIHPAYGVIFLLLPMAIYFIHSLTDFLNEKNNPIVIKPWMGPMGDFERYKEVHIDWFMLRWLLARNLTTLFCIILIVVNITLLLFS